MFVPRDVRKAVTLVREFPGWWNQEGRGRMRSDEIHSTVGDIVVEVESRLRENAHLEADEDGRASPGIADWIFRQWARVNGGKIKRRKARITREHQRQLLLNPT